MPQIPQANTDDTVRDEGDAADWLISQVFTGQHLTEELIDRKAPNGVYITVEMADHIIPYINTIKNTGEIERDCSHHGSNWQINGRADHILYDRETNILYIRDFKYGWKIVEPENNWTLISHAIGYCVQNQIQPALIRFEIYQPRPYHPLGTTRAARMTWPQLMQCYTQINNTLSNPTDMLTTSSECYKCPAMGNCPSAQIAAMNAIDVSYKGYVSNIDNITLEAMLDETDRAMEHLKEIQKAYTNLALERLRKGGQMKEYSVQTDLGNETWNDNITPEMLEAIVGKAVVKKKTLTPRQVINMGVDAAIVRTLSQRPSKGVKLVRVSASKRAEELFNRN